MSLPETTDSWNTIEQGVLQLANCCNIGGCNFPTEMLAGIRSLARPLNVAINSKRSRLSGAAVESVTALGLGLSFQSIIPLFFPSLIGLCARTNKVFTRRAKACIFAAIQNSPSPSLLPSLAKSVSHKSASVRIVAAEGVLLCLNSLDAPKFDHDTRAHLIEDVINSTTRDASAEVRTVGREILEVYKTILPKRAASFIARQDATASGSVPPVRSCSRPTEAKRDCFGVGTSRTLVLSTDRGFCISVEPKAVVGRTGPKARCQGRFDTFEAM
ncbi:hypothetical protein AZE42_04842 [Rhizopogon vesiculosus]|uniref:CLASP N-terminal domain-containing protein n=1 Tax=Rhizopogon vesiculosus TaxID=180088 RepID=A0A1J8PLD0_9AGAM|nr:hypothetical protein AZE42_04842 [Rhizopogon vesiculosus]